ncbi:MAG: ATP-grasp domain-containing protein [Lachnospiraceae bacterium]|nr:ATP-grasp domain-containing protein [Lachnospiraceae bacterium]
MDKQKSMMILGASALQVPAIKKAKELGYRIILVDYDENAVGFALADVKLVVSTLDQEEVYRQALIYKPDVVITSTSDGPVRTAAYVNEKLGKRPDLSYENSLCATIKSNMRDRLKQCGVPIPEYYEVKDFESFSEAVDQLNGYCIVKPADNAGSRGVVLLNAAESELAPGDIHEIKNRTYCYSRDNSRGGTVMVEEYMQGPEVSVEVMVVEGEPHILTITDKYITPPPYFVELAHCEPSRLDTEIQERIREVAAQAVRAIGIENAPAHVEVKVTEDGPKIVELAARLGGDFITSKLVPLSTGIDMVGASVLLATGEKPDLTPTRKQGAAIHFIHAEESQKGVLENITVPEALCKAEGVEEIALYKKPGETVQGTRSSNDRLGHVITVGETPEEAMERGKRILAQIGVEIG